MFPEPDITPLPLMEKTFVLEFWFEGSRLGASHWRGRVRDGNVDPEGEYRAVASAEAAFALVRDALQQATPAGYSVGPQNPPSSTLQGLVRTIRALFRRSI